MWINTRQPSDETRIHFVLPGFLQTRRSAGARMPTSVPRPPNLHSGVHVLHLAGSDQTASQMIWTAMLTPEIKGLASPNPVLPSTCFRATPFYLIFFLFWCAQRREPTVCFCIIFSDLDHFLISCATVYQCRASTFGILPFSCQAFGRTSFPENLCVFFCT